MADRDGYVSVERNDRGAGRGTSTVAWVALILALLALALAWSAFSQLSSLDERITQGIENSVQNTEEAIDAGPDGVDEDDTETGAGTDTTTPTTTDESTTTQ